MNVTSQEYDQSEVLPCKVSKYYAIDFKHLGVSEGAAVYTFLRMVPAPDKCVLHSAGTTGEPMYFRVSANSDWLPFKVTEISLEKFKMLWYHISGESYAPGPIVEECLRVRDLLAEVTV